MNISIIIDKSTFQSLNFAEIMRLTYYYKQNITPVLTLEIIGDLKKEFEGTNSTSPERVKDFAKKLFPVDTVINLHYKNLVKANLLGEEIIMDGRPIIGIHKAVKSESGQKGVVIAESDEEKAIYNWKEGKFSETDKLLSELWRTNTTQEGILEKLRLNLRKKFNSKIKDFRQLDEKVNETIIDPNIQENLLLSILENYHIDSNTAYQIFNKWFSAGRPLIKDYSPYAFHCLKVDSIFLFGLASNLISIRPTNRVDLEYLYYLPFCNIFTSNDKIHKNTVPLLLKEYQRFIVGAELKNDLKIIVEYIDSLGEEEKTKNKNFRNYPPIIEDSITYKLWNEFFGYPNNSSFSRVISDEELPFLINKFEEFERAFDNDSIDSFPTDDSEFLIKKSYLGKNDPCFCGSGKRLIDCCIPEDKFNQLAMEELKKEEKRRKV